VGRKRVTIKREFFLSLRWCSTKRPRQPTLLGAFTTLSRRAAGERAWRCWSATRTLYREPASAVSVKPGRSAACVRVCVVCFWICSIAVWPETRFGENTPMTSRAPFRPLTLCPRSCLDGWMAVSVFAAHHLAGLALALTLALCLSVPVGAQFISPCHSGVSVTAVPAFALHVPVAMAGAVRARASQVRVRPCAHGKTGHGHWPSESRRERAQGSAGCCWFAIYDKLWLGMPAMGGGLYNPRLSIRVAARKLALNCHAPTACEKRPPPPPSSSSSSCCEASNLLTYWPVRRHR